ncbi:phospholipase A1 member A isoform X2 [Drosophila virilis]|uniref:phospholipase A1 member A isoform X2 n=1 Tax=Drosophila virilis TaxID=7244 RepID=UPI001396274B|nr:phospholipase A1 member A [Drosophila virilis]
MSHRLLAVAYLLLVCSCRGASVFDFITQSAPHLDNLKEQTTAAPVTSKPFSNRDITVGPCKWAIGRSCPDPDVKYYIYTRYNVMDRQSLHIGETSEQSNLTDSYFNPQHPTKILIHGYNSDMFLNPLQEMRNEYLAKSEHNIIYVDWSVLAPGPCYISAVHNTRQAGACAAQLVERLVEAGNTDIHIIGFSLGAQVPNYIARQLKSFKLPRITGLDPAMPLFITAGPDDKLDPSDADFVDVIHTNALVQGKLERCGHADFYMNGGISQPGCTGPQWTNSFACSHQRAMAYYLESIRSSKGFWGWACSGYIPYLLGMCPPTNYLLEAGDNIRHNTRGMFLIDTNDTSPYALGKWTDLPTLGVKHPHTPALTLKIPAQSVDPLLQHIDQFGKLATNFNNLPSAPYAQDPYENWTSYSPTPHKDSESDDSVEEQEQYSTESADMDDRQLNKPIDWWIYRRNLTYGHIDNTIFSIPKVH